MRSRVFAAALGVAVALLVIDCVAQTESPQGQPKPTAAVATPRVRPIQTKAELRELATTIRKTERLAAAGRLTDAEAAFADCCLQLQSLAARASDPRVRQALERVGVRLGVVRPKLVAGGLKPRAVPPLPPVGGEAPADGSSPTEADVPEGEGTVSFALTVAPIFEARCAGCHGPQRQNANLSVASFTNLMRGGDSGSPVEPGDPDLSSLVRRIRGEDEPRMPPDGPALAEDEIEAIATWVREGARFDGDGPAMPLATVFASAQAKKLPPEELAQLRDLQAAKNWRLALPETPHQQRDTARFHIFHDLTEEACDILRKSIEPTTDAVFKLLGSRPDALGRAPVAVYAFRTPIDYAEFGLMVDGREVSAEERSHPRYDVLHPHLVISTGGEAEVSAAAELTQAVASLVVSIRTKGLAPPWLVEGTGRAARIRLHRRDEQTRAWLEAMPAAVASLPSAASLLNGTGDRATGAIAVAGFVEAMLRNPKFETVLTDLEAGVSFGRAFESVYKMTPERAIDAWRQSIARGQRR